MGKVNILNIDCADFLSFQADIFTKKSENNIFLPQDVNDELPRFRSDALVAEIAENAPAKTPLTLIGRDNLTEVYDPDQGTNGTFRLFLENASDMFEVTQ